MTEKFLGVPAYVYNTERAFERTLYTYQKHVFFS